MNVNGINGTESLNRDFMDCKIKESVLHYLIIFFQRDHDDNCKAVPVLHVS